MIELSKCPNCAEDDRVTIAGKEFCMRCGTPAEDNAKMGVDTTPSIDSTKLAPETESTNAQAPVLNASESAPNYQHNDSAMIMPTDSNLSVQKFNSPVVSSEQPVEQKSSVRPFVAPPRMESINDNDAKTSASAPAVAPAAIVASAASHEPAQVQNPSVMTPTMGTMSLDKRAGVLSDDQFDQLNKSVGSDLTIQNTAPMEQTAAQTATAATSVNSIAAMPSSEVGNSSNIIENSTLNQAPNKIAMSTDIYSDNSTEEETKNAHSNTQKPTLTKEHISNGKKASKAAKPVAIAVSIALLFGTGAYIWKMNYPSLAFKIASAKAGMSASMPGYVPTGYNLGGQIQTNPGTVSYNLINNNSADKKISITQTKTDWDSQALAENYVAPKVENYLALQAQGLTIYVMGQNQATWVNKGTWYNVESKSSPLNQDQIIKIATSL